MNGVGGYNAYKNQFQDLNGFRKEDFKAGKENSVKNAQSFANQFNSEAVKYERENGRVNEPSMKLMKNEESVELSERAQKLLEELKEKYSNVDIFVGDASSEEYASQVMGRSTKDYSLIIDAQTLEEMAANEEIKNQYMGYIDESVSSLDKIKESVENSEEGVEIESISISISTDGTVSFFAKLRESANAQKERIEKSIEEKKEEKKEQEKEALEKANEKKLDKYFENEPFKLPKTTTVSASSTEELLEAIKNVDFSTVPENTAIPGRFNFSV